MPFAYPNFYWILSADTVDVNSKNHQSPIVGCEGEANQIRCSTYWAICLPDEYRTDEFPHAHSRCFISNYKFNLNGVLTGPFIFVRLNGTSPRQEIRERLMPHTTHCGLVSPYTPGGNLATPGPKLTKARPAGMVASPPYNSNAKPVCLPSPSLWPSS